MKLFRRLLLSLFPEEFAAHAQHPVSMFLSLISPKQLFNIIHRRVAENFKLNLYDIALDPFEVNVGFGEQPTLQVKDVDQYYAYDVVAQMNGWAYYAPGNMATAVALVFAAHGEKVWQKHDWKYGYTCIMTCYLLTFIFVSRLRIFPEGTKKERYQWFVELFFEFYELVARQQGIEIEKKHFTAFKKEVLLHVEVFLFLFYFYQKMNGLFARSFLAPKEFYQWLFADEIKNPSFTQTIETFLANRQDIVVQKQFGGGDVNMCKLVFPADIQIRYILQGEDGPAIIQWVLAPLFDVGVMRMYMKSFLSNDTRLDDFLSWLFDWQRYQTTYFGGMRNLSQHVFRLRTNYEEEKEIDAFISSLESGKKSSEVHIPESLKKESAVMDTLMNFYVSFVGGFWTGRGDCFGLRIFKREFIDTLVQLCEDKNLKQDALQWYGGLLYTYSKNLFYYSYAYEHIRAGKEVFRLPYKSSYKEVYAHMYLLKLFDEHFLYTLFQDLNQGPLTITVRQSQVVTKFKHLFHERLRHCVQTDKEGLIRYLYGPIGDIIHMKGWVDTIVRSLEQEDYVTLKERIYTVDCHLRVHACELLAQQEKFVESYGDMGTIGICALLKETLFGFLLYTTYVQLQEREEGTSHMLHASKQIYIADVLQIASHWIPEFMEIIDTLLVNYYPLLELRIKLDDNQAYFGLALDNWKQYITHKTPDQAIAEVSGDDIVRCRGLYKTITYYNRRIVKP